MAKRKKVQKDKQRSTKHTHKTKDRVTRTPLKTEDMARNLALDQLPAISSSKIFITSYKLT